MDISRIDKNFAIKTSIEKDDVVFYNADEKGFKVYGIYREDGRYRRMPESVAKKVSAGVLELHACTAGGRVKFITDSNYVAIKAEMDGILKMPHFALSGSMGFDLYANNNYFKSFVPRNIVEDGYESVIDFNTDGLKEITINFPLYSNVKNLYIGIQKGAALKEAAPYRNTKPIVYYGSSITQGACASRPGMSYEAIISRRFNYNFVNLGFSGNAKAEDEMIEYVKGLDMSIFVYDYDYNAPTVEHLRNTHEKMFKHIRKAHPVLPIIMMSRPKLFLTEEEKERMKVVETTYQNAILAGDKNVYFIDGPTLMELCKDEGTVDGVHPTDFGFASMAKAVGDVIEKINIAQ